MVFSCFNDPRRARRNGKTSEIRYPIKYLIWGRKEEEQVTEGRKGVMERPDLAGLHKPQKNVCVSKKKKRKRERERTTTVPRVPVARLRPRRYQKARVGMPRGSSDHDLTLARKIPPIRAVIFVLRFDQQWGLESCRNADLPGLDSRIDVKESSLGSAIGSKCIGSKSTALTDTSYLCILPQCGH